MTDIFISCRSTHAAGHARALQRDLCLRFATDRVFLGLTKEKETSVENLTWCLPEKYPSDQRIDRARGSDLPWGCCFKAKSRSIEPI
jgi:hypothetical protein